MHEANKLMADAARILSAQRISHLSNLLLILILADMGAALTWRLLDAGEAPAAIHDRFSMQQNGERRADAAPSLSAAAAMHLFGKAETEQDELAGEVLDAPETRLNLKLKGIFALEQGGAVAIIAASGKSDRTYRVGDKIAGAAAVHKILSDRVILKRGERYETLTLPTERLAQQGAVRDTTAGPSGGRAASQRGLAGIRERLMKDPQQLFRLLKARPVVEEGRVKGYRVRPGRERELFDRAGLQPGDIVTGINGVSLDNPENLGVLRQQVGESSLVTLTLERAGRPLTLSFELR